MPTTIRLQIEIDQDQMDDLERLLKLGGLRTKKELLNNALTLLKWAARERGRGCAIASVNPQTGIYKELEMPILESIATNSGISVIVNDRDTNNAIENERIDEEEKVNERLRPQLATVRN